MAFKRGKRKILSSFGLQDFYKYYKSKTKNPVDYKTYSAVIKQFNDAVLDEIVYNSREFSIPGRLGKLRIKRFKNNFLTEEGDLNRTFLKPDWKRTWELWRRLYPEKTDQEIKNVKEKKLIYHTNEHTDNHYYRFYWDKLTCNLTNHTLYNFKPTRTNKKKLIEAIKDEDLNIEYYE